jgi:hypothetical protein
MEVSLGGYTLVFGLKESILSMSWRTNLIVLFFCSFFVGRP